jgi:hypothetical protein
MNQKPQDLLSFAQRMIALIDSARHNSTYKFATLMAIIDICAENSIGSNGVLEIDITEISHRVVAYYWNQTREFMTTPNEGHLKLGVLRQNQQRGKSIPNLVEELRAKIEPRGISSAESARETGLSEYMRLVYMIELTIAQQPLTHLQTPNGKLLHNRRDGDFIFDARGFSKKMRRRQLEIHGPVRLEPGVAYSLRVLSPLLKPLIEQRWTYIVLALNQPELDIPDVGAFLFAPVRKTIVRAAPLLRDAQRNICFYCDSVLSHRVDVDHVIPWSRIPLDGIANLVLAHKECNLNKSDTLPIWSHVERAFSRPLETMKEISKESRIPVLMNRTEGAARGIYSVLAPGTILWRGVKAYEYAS